MAVSSLSQNKTKTKTLNFGTAAGANQAEQFVPNSRVATSAKYLGLEIDHKLSFKEHANQLLKKTAKNVPLLYQLKKFLPSSALFRAYKFLIQLIYEYSTVVYSIADKKVMEKVKNQQKLLIRIVFLKKKKVRIETQIAIKIQNTPSEVTSCLRAFEASGSCFMTNKCSSRGK